MVDVSINPENGEKGGISVVMGYCSNDWIDFIISFMIALCSICQIRMYCGKIYFVHNIFETCL